MADHYNIAIIGAGPGGYIAALKAGQMGASVCVIEKHHLGGTCLNYGCIPSKALLSSAELVHQIHHADKWGVKVGAPEIDWPAIQKRKDKVIRQLRGGVNQLFRGRGVTLLEGEGKLDGPGRIAIDGEKSGVQSVTADKIILATGSAPARIPGWPDDPQVVCTSDEAVHWSSLPKRLLVVGGGVIGCEFACMMNGYGVDVTVVEMMPKFLPGLDEDLGDALMAVFSQRGIQCFTDTKVEDLQLAGDAVTARLSNGQTIETDRVLVSVGRRPNSAGLGLESAGVETSQRGFIPVDDRMRTNHSDIYCIGDANGRCLLAHAASAHGVAAVEDALGHGRDFDAPIPSAVYTFPEIGAVGMTQRQAEAADIPIAVGRFPIGHLGKAMATNHTDGFVKTIRDRASGALLGAHMIGHNATECIAAVGTVLHQKVTMRDLAEVVFAHPTISESIKESAEDALGMGLHLPPRKVLRAAALVG